MFHNHVRRIYHILYIYTSKYILCNIFIYTTVPISLYLFDDHDNSPQSNFPFGDTSAEQRSSDDAKMKHTAGLMLEGSPGRSKLLVHVVKNLVVRGILSCLCLVVLSFFH